MAGDNVVEVSYTFSYDLDDLREATGRDDYTDEELSTMANDDYVGSGGGEWMVKRIDSRPRATCRYCQHGIVLSGETWIAPDAGTDVENGDGIWRESCPDHDTLTAEHEPEDDSYDPHGGQKHHYYEEN